MEPTHKRDVEGVPSAKFLQARITALSTTLIKRLENIFAAALDDVESPASTSTADRPPPPSLTATSVQHFQLDVESSAIVRAAEEILMLTRTMKELWLFGHLDTLRQQDRPARPGGYERSEGESESKIQEDIRTVEDGFQRFLDRFESIMATAGEATPRLHASVGPVPPE